MEALLEREGADRATTIIGATSGEQLFLHQDRQAEMPAYLFGRNMSEKALGSSISPDRAAARLSITSIARLRRQILPKFAEP